MKNLFAATYAPMKENGDLNLAIIKDYAGFLTHNQLDGVFINGSTGDFVSLSTEERNQLLDQWAISKPANLFLINHVGHNNLIEAMALAEYSVGKADAVSAIAPFYFVPGNMEKLLEYCTSIAEKAGDLPFYYYHLPALTGAQFDMNTFSDLAKERIPNYAGIKFTENNMVEFQKVNSRQKDKNIYFGVDEGFVSSLAMGAEGWVGSTYNQLAPLYHSIKECFDENNISEANRLQSLAIEFVESLAVLGGFNGAGKSFMKTLGIDCGPSRYPHRTLTDDQLKNVRTKFKSLGLDFYFSKNS